MRSVNTEEQFARARKDCTLGKREPANAITRYAAGPLRLRLASAVLCIRIEINFGVIWS